MLSEHSLKDWDHEKEQILQYGQSIGAALQVDGKKIKIYRLTPKSFITYLNAIMNIYNQREHKKAVPQFAVHLAQVLQVCLSRRPKVQILVASAEPPQARNSTVDSAGFAHFVEGNDLQLLCISSSVSVLLGEQQGWATRSDIMQPHRRNSWACVSIRGRSLSAICIRNQTNDAQSVCP